MGLMNWLLKIQQKAMAKKGIKIEDPAQELPKIDEELRDNKLEISPTEIKPEPTSKFNAAHYGVALHCEACGETIQGKLRIMKVGTENKFFHKKCLKKIGKQTLSQSINVGI